MDLTSDLHLRMALALHTKPLIARLQSEMPLQNDMTLDIKQKYSFAFDLASEYSYLLSQKFKVSVKDDEISYLALHFIVGLHQADQSSSRKQILLISEQRKSNTILIQQQILQWFPDTVQSVRVMNLNELNPSDPALKTYDAVITTTLAALQIIPNAVPVDFFLTEKDHVKIEMALSGITNRQDILNHFHPDLFYSGRETGKAKIIEILCQKAEKLYPSKGRLLKSVLLHETIANTYFGNQIAMPHPDQPLSDSSFICVALPEKPIDWDGQKGIRIILLVALEKNSPAAIQIWQYLSYLISDEDLVQRILEKRTYDNFIRQVSDYYGHLLGQ